MTQTTLCESEAIVDMCKTDDLNKKLREMETWRDRWPIIREAYRHFLPGIIDAEKNNSCVGPYFINWLPLFSPIEEAAWCDIRGNGISMFPQFPINGVFVDFANPSKKIAIEMDGKKFHNAKKDKKRDDMLSKRGWLVFRITGSECFASTCAPWEELEPYGLDFEERMKWWILNTGEGVIFSLKMVFFREGMGSDEYYGNYIETLKKHCSNDSWGRIDCAHFSN